MCPETMSGARRNGDNSGLVSECMIVPIFVEFKYALLDLEVLSLVQVDMSICTDQIAYPSRNPSHGPDTFHVRLTAVVQSVPLW